MGDKTAQQAKQSATSATGHGRQDCPASEAECHKCHRRGHFKITCRSNDKIGEVRVHKDDDPFLGVIQADALAVNHGWKITLSLNNCLKELKINIGADVTESLYGA